MPLCRAWWAVALGVSCASVACGLSAVGAMVAADDRPSGAAADGAASPGDVDGGSSADAITIDAGIDAGSDGGARDAGDGGALGFCASQTVAHDVCVDFDDGIFPGPLALRIANGGSAASSSVAFSSAPGAARATATASNAYAYLDRRWTAGVRVIDIAFSARLDGSGYVQFGGVTLAASGTYYELLFSVSSGKHAFGEWSQPTGGTPRSMPGTASGSWHRFRLRVDLPAGAGRPSYEIWEDGVSRYNGPIAAASLPAITDARAVFGAFFSGASNSAVVFVDDVIIDATP